LVGSSVGPGAVGGAGARGAIFLGNLVDLNDAIFLSNFYAYA
jgi:hypothetical protein